MPDVNITVKVYLYGKWLLSVLVLSDGAGATAAFPLHTSNQALLVSKIQHHRNPFAIKQLPFPAVSSPFLF